MATPAQMSANSTGWSLKKLPTISFGTPSQSLRRVAPARRLFYHMALRGAPFARFTQPLRRGRRPCELERGQGSDELAMGDLNVKIGRDGAPGPDSAPSTPLFGGVRVRE